MMAIRKCPQGWVMHCDGCHAEIEYLRLELEDALLDAGDDGWDEVTVEGRPMEQYCPDCAGGH